MHACSRHAKQGQRYQQADVTMQSMRALRNGQELPDVGAAGLGSTAAIGKVDLLTTLSPE